MAIRTVGCRLNQAETARIVSTFKSAGYRILSFDDECDVYIIHSCTITKNAERKSVKCATSIKKTFPDAVVVLAGCAVEADTENRLKNKGIDLLVNQKDKLRIPEMLKVAGLTCESPTDSEAKTSEAIIPHFDTTRALIKVQDGCNFRCSYCIVPAARGNPFSLPFSEIITETKDIAASGYKEIVLTGANLGRFNSENRTLIHLLESIEKINGIRRIRLSSIELSTIEREVIDYMADSEKVCHYLHIPLQSGDDTILGSMGRRYTSSQYADTIQYAAEKMDLPGLGTDIIAGFPGETESQHANTVKLVESLPLNNFHIFPYSIRPGTKAATMPGHLENRIKKQRCAELISAGESKRKEFADKYIDKGTSVLIERADDKGFAKGWTGEYLEAEISESNLKRNDIIDFIADKATSEAVLKGSL